MDRSRKWMVMSILVIPVLVSGIVISQPTLAEKASNSFTDKVEKLKKLKAQENEEKAKLASFEGANTQEEIDKALAQGKKAKDIGLEIKKAQDEVSPPDQREVVQVRIATQKRLIGQSRNFYRDRVNDPEHGAQYQKALEIADNKKLMLDQIEQDFIKNTKSAKQLEKELDELKAIRELN